MNVECPHCQGSVRLMREDVGQVFRCFRCNGLFTAPITWQAVQCVVCRLIVRKGDYGDLRQALPGPHYPVLNQKTMSAYEADGSDMFSTYCEGSFVLGPVVKGETSSAHEIADEDIEPVILWEQGRSP